MLRTGALAAGSLTWNFEQVTTWWKILDVWRLNGGGATIKIKTWQNSQSSVYLGMPYYEFQCDSDRKLEVIVYT